MDKFDIFLEVFSDEYKAKHHMMYPRKQIRKVDPEFWEKLKKEYENRYLNEKVFKTNNFTGKQSFRAIIQNNNIYWGDSDDVVHDDILRWMLINGQCILNEHIFDSWHRLGPIKTGFLTLQSHKKRIYVSESYYWFREAGDSKDLVNKYFSWVFTQPQFKGAIQKFESLGYTMHPIPFGYE